MKKCFKCKKKKTINEFYKHPQMPDGFTNKCKDCTQIDVKLNYQKNIVRLKEYELNRNRFNLQRIFINRWLHIKNRCNGVVSNGRYLNFEYLTKQEFIDWCKQDKNFSIFMKIWNKWKNSNFARRHTPTIDRIDNKRGYLVDNIQWLSLRNNTIKYYKKDIK